MLATILALATLNPLAFPKTEQLVSADFDEAAAARAATLRVLPLPAGKLAAFTSRWDDSTDAHFARAEMFRRNGFRATFFANADERWLARAKDGILARGSRIGNHTTSHVFLMDAAPGMMFSEVILNRIRIETIAQTHVSSFVIPFSWSCSIDTNRCQILGRILADTGHFVSSDYASLTAGQTPEVRFGSWLFASNDRQPDAKAFAKGFANQFQKATRDTDNPKIAWGIHSWCTPEGLLEQERFLRPVLANTNLWLTDDSEYGAYRYGFRNANVRKVAVRGKTAVFALDRYAAAQLGADAALDVAFSVPPKRVAADGLALAAKAPGVYSLAAPIGCARQTAEIGRDALAGVRVTLTVDERNGTATVAVAAGAQAIERPYTVLYPAVCWRQGRHVAEKLGGTFALGERRPELEYGVGPHLYAASFDFVLEGRPRRIWTTLQLPGGDYPSVGAQNGATLVMAPFAMEKSDERFWLAASVPGSPLKDLGSSRFERWTNRTDSAGAPFVGVSYIRGVTGRKDPGFRAEIDRLFASTNAMGMAAVSFFCERAGEKTLHFMDARDYRDRRFTINAPYVFYLNGRREELPVGTPMRKIPVRRGENRLLLPWRFNMDIWRQSQILYSVSDGDPMHPVTFRQIPRSR